MSDAIGFAKSVQITKMASDRFDVPYDKIRFVGDVPRSDAWQVPCEERNSDYRIGSVVTMLCIGTLARDVAGPFFHVLAGQCESCGLVYVAEAKIL